MSHIESGLAGVSEQRLRRLASHYACTDEEFIDALVAMATDRTHGWWEEYRGLLPTSFLNLSELDHHARFQRNVAILFVPGLLQTEDYARAVFSNRIPELPEEELELRVRHRIARRLIIEGPSPIPSRCSDPRSGTADDGQRPHRVTSPARTHPGTLRSSSHHRDASSRSTLDGFSRGGSTMAYVGGSVAKLDTVIRDGPTGAVYRRCRS